MTYRDIMKQNERIERWKAEEREAHIRGWDFSHIDGRCEEAPLPWEYRTVIERYRKPEMRLLDYDTGGGEFLLSLRHPFDRTAATEGYEPNAALCKERLDRIGISMVFSDNARSIFKLSVLFRTISRNGSVILVHENDDHEDDTYQHVNSVKDK